MNKLNRQLLTHDQVIEKLCAQVSDETAHLLLELARSITDSPLGTGDGNVIHAQRLLEARLGLNDSNPGKTFEINS